MAASLLKAQFEKSAYGCKLYCCWCAQDIEANRFWESMGFVPIAFRAGSQKKDRLHVFWQKRIREGDTTTPWWFPSETNGGLMDASRIALPIPPGVKWWDEMPRIVEQEKSDGVKTETRRRASKKAAEVAAAPVPYRRRFSSRYAPRGTLWFAPKAAAPVAAPAVVPVAEAASEEQPKRKARVKKANPELAKKARELRDRWQEQVDAGLLVLESMNGKYDVARTLPRLDATTLDAKRLAA